MSIPQYAVTELRVAALCPRLHYFRRQALAAGSRPPRVFSLHEGERPSGGALFHRTVERFTRLALEAPEVASALQRARTTSELHQYLAQFVNQQCVNLKGLAKHTVAYRQGFVAAEHAYLEELACLMMYGMSAGVAASDIIRHLFGDTRRAVDVTFHLDARTQSAPGLEGAVRVTGNIDYIFFDWRAGRRRLFDYKVTERDPHGGDLMQVFAYALMHNQQHGTQPDVAVYYVAPGNRHVEERAFSEVWARRPMVYNHLASMLAWERYEPAQDRGLKPPGNPALCGSCPFRDRCESVLGPKNEGERLTAFDAQKTEPLIESGADPEAAVAELQEHQPEREPPEGPEGSPNVPTGSVPPGKEPAGPEQDSPDDKPSPDKAPDPASLPPDKLWLGKDVTGAPLLVDPCALNTHVAVVGAAGAGKTWMGKVIAEEAIRNRIPVIAIDPQGDLVQFLTQRAPDEFAGDAQQRSAYDEFTARVLPRVYTPGSSHGIRMALNPIRMSHVDELSAVGSEVRRREELAAQQQLIASNLVNLANLNTERGVQETFLYQLLRGMAKQKSLSLPDMVHAIRHPTEVGIEDPDLLIRKPLREKLAHQLNSFVMGPSAGLFRDGEPLDIGALLRPQSDGRVPLNVLYLNAMPSDAQKQFFVASVAAEIYRWMTTEAQRGDLPNLLFYIDEARDYIPAGTVKTAAKDPLIRLFSQGRKYGVACLLCTQSPRSVDYNVFANCSSKVIGRLEAQQDVNRVREWFTQGGSPSWLLERKGAERGTFVARWDDASLATREGKAFHSRLLYSVHEGAWPPDRVEKEVSRPE